MSVIVTGAAGFIGANLVKALNQRGETDIVAVDNLTRADKFHNLVDCEIADYLDKNEFLDAVEAGELDGAVEAVLHQGARSDTMEHGREMSAESRGGSCDDGDLAVESEAIEWRLDSWGTGRHGCRR